MSYEQWPTSEVLWFRSFLGGTGNRVETFPMGYQADYLGDYGATFSNFSLFHEKIYPLLSSAIFLLCRSFGCRRWEVWPCPAPWRVCSIGRWGWFCSDLPRWVFLLILTIRFRFSVLLYVTCYVFLRLERRFMLFFRKLPWFVYVRQSAFFASRRDGSAFLNLEFFFNEGHSKSRRNCCYVYSSMCLETYFNVLARFSKGRLREVKGNG